MLEVDPPTARPLGWVGGSTLRYTNAEPNPMPLWTLFVEVAGGLASTRPELSLGPFR